ncbi:MAG: hypothetical protein K2Q18_13860, partial [Bdellovibrionales bacterium]|nr:hypothetical protein [Bdellovibrionales bacterium]
MKKFRLALSIAILTIAFGGSVYSQENCVNCGPKQVPGMPTSNSKIGPLEKVAASVTGISVEQSKYLETYCSKFKQITPNEVSLTLEEMEATSFTMKSFFNTPQCQTEGYNDASSNVKSPII